MDLVGRDELSTPNFPAVCRISGGELYGFRLEVLDKFWREKSPSLVKVNGGIAVARRENGLVDCCKLKVPGDSGLAEFVTAISR